MMAIVVRTVAKANEVDRIDMEAISRHHVRGFDDRNRIVPYSQSQIVNRLIGDERRNNNAVADADSDMARPQRWLGFMR
jgi:hypothetical protein